MTYLKVVLRGSAVPVPNEAKLLVVLITLAVALLDAVAVIVPEYEIVDVPLPPAMENKPL